MAGNQSSGPNDGSQWTSPRAKARATSESTKNTLCRNVVIYGYCRNEKDGCPYNHDPTKKASASTGGLTVQNENIKRRFNVESPSFTPGPSDTNGSALPVKSAFSPKAAVAAPFTPKSSRSNLVPGPTLSRHQSTEWSKPEIREFVPQSFNAPSHGEQTTPTLADPFNPYSDSSNYSLESTPPSQINPYATDTINTTSAPFFPPQTGYTQPLQYHLYAPLAPYKEKLQAYQRTAHNFFISEELRQDLQRKAEASLQVLPNSNLPASIEHFHSLVPLDIANQKSAAALGYNTWIYKAISSRDGFTYALRRIEGFRLTSEKMILPVQAWKRIDNANIVRTHDCFTTRAFGDSSLVFVTDFHPLSKTLAEQHLQVSPSLQRGRAPVNIVQEQVLWSYMVQIATALKTIHSSGLAAKTVNISKVILTSKNRVRLNGCSILDVIQYNDQTPLHLQQQEDMKQLGQLILIIATQNPSAASTGAGTLSRTYSSRLRDCITALIDDPPTIDDFISSIADHFAIQLDSSFHSEDNLYSELSRELENSRLVRLLAKLGCINERPEYNPNEQHHSGGAPHSSHASTTQWSETGERYFLKLFRDFVFHQVGPDGRPVVDLGHIIMCLNKLDAGSEEKITLVSRDEQNVFVVSYKEVKRAVESSFQELFKGNRRI